jgi:sulfite reductase (NADPH) flavoprotein alpha-component
MTSVPLIPETAPFSAEQRAWLNGFLAGIFSRGAATAAAAEAPVKEKRPLLVAFGSQSGNAEGLAKRLAKDAAGRGFAAKVAGLDSLQPADLAKAGNVLVITSTWGEGDMPDNAASFWQRINQNGSSPSFEGVNYSVLALGDRNYGETFCLAGKKLDARLAELGAHRIADRVDCDVDYDGPARQWSDAAFAALNGTAPAAKTEVAPPQDEAAPTAQEIAGWSRNNPFPAKLLANVPLNGTGSEKDTRHVTLSLAGSGLAYEVGDALGVYVRNCPEVVDAIITAHGFDPQTPAAVPDGRAVPLREALMGHYEIRHLLGKTPSAGINVAAFIEGLRRLQPRLYSIASSPKAHPEEVHLCVATVRYSADGIQHQGVASTFLADRLAVGDTTGVFFQTANHFRLPADGAKPVIMIGPGTGIAPFRAFLEERQAVGATGRNWLFFGDQRRATDFLYREQVEAWQRDGHLTRLDLAFSRDQSEKVYVQNRMLEAAADLWAWIQDGAHLYVCGDAKRMAKDVDTALHTVVQTAGGRSADDAAEYVAALKAAERYQRDVY